MYSLRSLSADLRIRRKPLDWWLYKLWAIVTVWASRVARAKVKNFMTC